MPRPLSASPVPTTPGFEEGAAASIRQAAPSGHGQSGADEPRLLRSRTPRHLAEPILAGSATLQRFRPIGPTSLLAAQLGSFADAGDMHVARWKRGDAVRGQSAAR